MSQVLKKQNYDEIIKQYSENDKNYKLSDILKPVDKEMDTLRDHLIQLVAERLPILRSIAKQIFQAGGKRLRPAIIFLVAKATRQINGYRDVTDNHIKLGEISEMIHTSSLVHDDVLDDAELRRGVKTINTTHGARTAVLAGDFFFAQASWYLAVLGNLEVIRLISQVIANFADGEIKQLGNMFNTDVTLDQYLDKSFYKTASLMAASCKSAAIFSGCNEQISDAMYTYGKHLGLAFQIIDDILDFTQTTEKLGKPQGQDLASGNLTAPTIFAMRNEPQLRGLIKSKFEKKGQLEQALQLVHKGKGIEASRNLAKEHSLIAAQALENLPECEATQALYRMVGYLQNRLY